MTRPMPAANFGDPRLPKRFWSMAYPCPMSGCWLWMGAGNGVGYGKFQANGRNKYAHRAAYEAVIGTIPDGMVIDHKCRTPPCCNPEHLEPVSKLENARRGIKGNLCVACPKGHPRVPKSPGERGGRVCGECHRLAALERSRSRVGKIVSMTARGEITVNARLCGAWAVHRSREPGRGHDLAITHVGTGLSVADSHVRTLTKRQAVAAAWALNDAPDVDGTDDRHSNRVIEIVCAAAASAPPTPPRASRRKTDEEKRINRARGALLRQQRTTP